MFSSGFAITTFIHAFVVILYCLFAGSASKAAKTGVRVGVVMLAGLGTFLVKCSYQEKILIVWLFYLVELAVAVCYIEINRILRTARAKIIFACATGLLLLAVPATMLLLSSLSQYNTTRDFWAYMCAFIVYPAMCICPHLFATAFLVGRKMSVPTKKRHTLAVCTLVLCGCAVSEAWISADEARCLRELNEWKQNHVYNTPEENAAIAEEIDRLRRKISSASPANPEDLARIRTLYELASRDRFKRNRAWPNGRYSIHWWEGVEIHNSIY
jgi:hypothetical protein